VGWIELDGAGNVRDLGGLPGRDGRRTATRRLLRGDNMQELSPADVSLLVTGIGVSTVIDLRSPAEVSAAGAGPLTRVESVRHLHFSLLPELAAADTAEAALAIRLDGAAARYAGDLRCGLYLGYLEERPDQVVGALRGIAAAPGAALVNCAAGKDRTGVVVALALSIAGVQSDAIIADYAASAERVGEVMARLGEAPVYAAAVAGRPVLEHAPRAETMAAFLDQLDTRYGGALRWLAGHGYGAADVSQLRSALLSP
jgi:protein tyrosine/serine phosphatase